MNRERRSEIKKNNKKIDDIIDILYEYKSDLETIQEDEEYAYDNMPEGLQNSERGESMQEAIDIIYENLDKINDIMGKLEDIKSNLVAL